METTYLLRRTPCYSTYFLEQKSAMIQLFPASAVYINLRGAHTTYYRVYRQARRSGYSLLFVLPCQAGEVDIRRFQTLTEWLGIFHRLFSRSRGHLSWTFRLPIQNARPLKNVVLSQSGFLFPR